MPPRNPTIAEAQPHVPFPIQAPIYIPDGYEMDPHVSLLDGPHYGHEVKGVRFVLRKYTPSGYRNISINQFLAEGTFPTVQTNIGDIIAWEIIDFGDFEAEVRQADTPEGPKVAVEWETEYKGKRIFYAVRSDLDFEETLEMVRSFQAIHR
ncbi:MAG: hypothetical protein OXR67_01830 [Chloroflexota bacterium]|nr:hypothetical protein [Chloroflexota bacterium]MDE2937648.1 hypothetical protein [Chloroflexota bacterium]